MDVGGGRIHAVDEHLDECVDNHFIIVIITQFEGVVEKDVSFNFIIIRIDNL